MPSSATWLSWQAEISRTLAETGSAISRVTGPAQAAVTRLEIAL